MQWKLLLKVIYAIQLQFIVRVQLNKELEMITAFFEGKILNICLERFGKNLGENSCSPLKFEHRI